MAPNSHSLSELLDHCGCPLPQKYPVNSWYFLGTRNGPLRQSRRCKLAYSLKSLKISRDFLFGNPKKNSEDMEREIRYDCLPQARLGQCQ